jgi:hypothetical protein
MKSSAAMNVDAELKVLKLNEEIRELVKDTRAKVCVLIERLCRVKSNGITYVLLCSGPFSTRKPSEDSSDGEADGSG